MRFNVVSVICAVAVLTATVCAGENDVAAQLQLLQEQMRTMSQKMESQQKKIDDQDRTITQLKAVRGDIGNSPAAGALSGKDIQPARVETKGDTSEEKPRRSYELPAVTVTGEQTQSGELREEDRIGDAKQPRWTARRRFTETRAYVIPKGNFELEYWSIVEVPHKEPGKDHPVTTVETQYEFEIGLPYRFQADIYGVSHSQGDQKGFLFDQQKAELRWALADWNVIPGNPTLYAEYIWNNAPEPDHAEFKLLFCGEMAKRWHWAYNQVFEHALGGEGTNSYESTAGVSYTVKDERLSVGMEAKLAYEDTDHNRGLHKPEFLIGPSIQFAPLKQMHVDWAPLFGTTDKSPQFKSVLIVGWEF
jgi:hypothetical protein